MSSCARGCGRKYFRFFFFYFIINFYFLCLRDQIFRVLLEHFICEVVSKWQREQMFQDFIFSGSYHWFRAKVSTEAIAIFLLVYFIIDFFVQTAARAVTILRVTASWGGMCWILLSYFFINFGQVTAGVGVFLRSFHHL